jgi:hypothetical protein
MLSSDTLFRWNLRLCDDMITNFDGVLEDVALKDIVCGLVTNRNVQLICTPSNFGPATDAGSVRDRLLVDQHAKTIFTDAN